MNKLLIIMALLACQTPVSLPPPVEMATGLCTPVADIKRTELLDRAKEKLSAPHLRPTDEATILIELIAGLEGQKRDHPVIRESFLKLKRIDQTYGEKSRSKDVMLEVLAALDCPGTDRIALDKTFEVTDEWQAVSQAIYTLKRLEKKAASRPVQDSIGLLNEIERLTR